MKCQNCGRNEATYYYKSSINGRVTETHLCADCAGRSCGTGRSGYALNALKSLDALRSGGSGSARRPGCTRSPGGTRRPGCALHALDTLRPGCSRCARRSGGTGSAGEALNALKPL